MGREKERPYKIIWSPRAEDSFDTVTSHIALNSVYYSIKVGNEIISLINSLEEMPMGYPECFDLPTKNKIYRMAVYASTYKIIYKIVKHELWILDIFHGKRNPALLKKLRKVKP